MTDTTSRPRGVFSAAATPLTADYMPDHPVFIEHCRHLLAEGCDGIAMLGTTGEANSFSIAERKALLEAVVASGIDPARLLPGTGVAALTDTVELTRHALAQGVRHVVMLPPFYYKGVTEDGIFAAYSEIVERVGDDRLGVILYHIPQMSAVPIPHEVIARLLARYPKTFVGIKDSAGDFANMETMAQRFPDFSVLAGADPLMLPLLRKGGSGCITATSNLIARDLAFLFHNADDRAQADAVERAQARVVAARNRVSRFAQIPSVKALIAERSGHDGWRRMRPPLVWLKPEEEAALLEETAIAA
jgi:4-hydroxy-tetrahydrodipicolinate synthase